MRKHPVALALACLLASPVFGQGLSFVRYAGNPLLSRGLTGSFDAAKIGPRAILYNAHSGVWQMWYEAVTGPNTATTAHATSRDGVTWTKRGVVMTPTTSWEGTEVTPSSILFEDGLYKLWYHGFDPSTGTRAIGFAWSPDGLAWTKHPGNPILARSGESVYGPNVLHIGSHYYMLYVSGGSLWLTISPDGITWGPSNLALVPEPQESGLGHSSALWDGATAHVFYTSWAWDGHPSIAYATTTDGFTWVKRGVVLSRPHSPLGRGDDYGVLNPNVFHAGSAWGLFYGGFVSCCPEDMGVNLALGWLG